MANCPKCGMTVDLGTDRDHGDFACEACEYVWRSRTIRESLDCEGFIQDALTESELTALLSYEEWPIDSACGVECAKLISLALPLIAASDKAARPLIWRGVVAAMSVVCCG
jgi:hypothetical protein